MVRTMIALSLAGAFALAGCSYETREQVASAPEAHGGSALAAITGGSALGAGPMGGVGGIDVEHPATPAR